MTTESLDNLVLLMGDPEQTGQFTLEAAGIVRALKIAHLRGEDIPPGYLSRLRALIDGQTLFLELHRNDLQFIGDLESCGLAGVA